MDSNKWQQVEHLYHAALACEPKDRSSLLDQADPEIKREVERLLGAEGSLLDRPAWEQLQDGTVATLGPGTLLGRYEIEARLGLGGMGEVFRARDTRLGRSVAIKTSQERFNGRFETEARAISALNHPHVCTLYDAGPNYLVMEFVEGETLGARLRQGGLPLEETLRYGVQIAEALAEAHAHGIVHRDLKPANIMLTRHGVKVLDFGLAKLLAETGLTQSQTIMGTPGYMAPEQVEGLTPSGATDLFAFGLVLYEMAVGRPPFPGGSLGWMLSTGAVATIPALPERGPASAPELDGLIRRLLAKNPAERPGSAGEVAGELAALAERGAAPVAAPSVGQRKLAVGVVVLLAAALSGGFWLYRRMEQRRWVGDEAIPQIAKLAPQQPLAAYLLLLKAERILPDDRLLAELAKSSTQLTSIQSSPAGAEVEIQDYDKPGAWFELGVTPLKKMRVPKGYFRWRVSKAGVGAFISAPATADSMEFPLGAAAQGGGMVPVPAGPWGDYIGFIGWMLYDLPAYGIDQFEVTNAQFQKFVDQGGYQDREYWREKFLRDGKELSWEQAMELLRDPTGRPGPSTWAAGHFPPGQANYPVSGVSWYEASAYAAFAGKSLPALSQWYKAAPGDLAAYAARVSNYGGKGPAAVGTFAGVGPFGTYDMAGNVREWALNAVGNTRFILGGAWGTQTYSSFDPDTLPPFDRSPRNGFRTVHNQGPLPAEAAAPVIPQGRDFAKVKPVSDEVFQVYRSMYAYDHTPLDAKQEGTVESTADWTKERISINAGYGEQRLTMFLFLPKNVRPPFQTVVFFPSARVQDMSDSRVLGDMQFCDYVIQSGRALLYPVYDQTYERVVRDGALAGTIEDLQLTIRWAKEVGRSVDYLATRKDIDATRIGYLGVSMGAAYGVIFAALDERFRAIVLLDGGYFLEPPPRGRDQAEFALRVTKPVLMVNGRYDFSFSPELAQEPMFRMLGTPAAEKRRVVFDAPHDVSQQKEALAKEVLAWLDKYLGRVN